MHIYQLHSSKLPEPVTFQYNTRGYLISFESTGLTDEQLNWVYAHFPTRIESIKILQANKNLKFVEVPVDIDFEKFFSTYSRFYGERVDKKKAETIWERTSKNKQLAAFEFIPNYFSRVKRSCVAPKMAKTYLNQEPWND